MSGVKRARTLKFIVSGLGLLLLCYIAIVLSLQWTFRAHTYTIRSAPGSLSNDRVAMQLAEAALRLHGADPSAYIPASFSDGATVAHNVLSSNRVSIYWLPRSTNDFGLFVHLEQNGSNVECSVGRAK